MLLRQEVGDGVDVLAVEGRVGRDDAAVLARAVEGVIDQAPAALVVDLREVTSLAPEAAEALRALSERASGWPRTSLCLCGPPGAGLLADHGVHPTRAEAVQHAEGRASSQRRVVDVDHGPHGPAQARRAVAECAARLELCEEADDLLIVVSEMVTNAVRHGAPPVRLEVSADDDVVLVSVADGSPWPPQVRPADETAEGGRGMTLVDRLSSDHGVLPQPPGKTVWASLSRRPPGGPTP